jgi:hypothetical protein
MSTQQSAAFKSRIAAAIPTAIDPERFQRFLAMILQFLPIFMAMFSKPAPAPGPTPAPAPIQAGAAITTIEGLLEFVEKTIELNQLTDEQRTKVYAAVEALAAFLTM